MSVQTCSKPAEDQACAYTTCCAHIPELLVLHSRERTCTTVRKEGLPGQHPARPGMGARSVTAKDNIIELDFRTHKWMGPAPLILYKTTVLGSKGHLWSLVSNTLSVATGLREYIRISI